MLRVAAWAMLGAVVVFAVSVLLHNVLSVLLGTEEAIFFFLAILVSPAVFLAGALVGVAVLIWRLLVRILA